MTGIAKSVTRVFGLIVKELRDLARRPAAILSLVLGPLAIMALFGLGFEGHRQPFDTVIVLPKDTQLARDVESYRRIPTAGIRIVGVTEDVAAARERLATREIRMLVIVPGDAEEKFRSGEQATLKVEWNEVDPIEHNVAEVSTQMLVKELNSQIIAAAAEEGMRVASMPEKAIPPQVVANPLKAEVDNTAPIEPSVMFFFGPAVFAIVLQHLGVTLTALSLVRERLSGAMDLFRVSPVRSWEVLVGKYVAYGILSAVVAVVVGLLMTRTLGIPLLGSPERLATAIGLLTFASLGVGLLISLIADSERQAVQLAMIYLLVSVFFSGFVLPIDEFRPIVQPIAYALPVTYGIQLFQDVMLRGGRGETVLFVGLALLALALYALDAARLRMVMRRAA